MKERTKNAERQARYLDRLRANGYVQISIIARPGLAEKLAELAKLARPLAQPDTKRLERDINDILAYLRAD